MKHVFYTNLSAALVLLAAAGSVDSVADSNSYRWQNSSGETVFSDQPPHNGEKYDVISAPSTLKPLTSDAGDDVPQEDESSESGKGDGKNNAQLCESAKKNLLKLEGSDEVSMRNYKGEEHELSPQERTIAQQTAKARIDVYCN